MLHNSLGNSPVFVNIPKNSVFFRDLPFATSGNMLTIERIGPGQVQRHRQFHQRNKMLKSESGTKELAAEINWI